MHFKELSDNQLVTYIQDENNDDMSIDDAKEELFLRYKNIPQFMLRTLKMKYTKNDETDLIHHGYFLINVAINNFKVDRGCPFEYFLKNVMKKGLLYQYYHKDKYRAKEITMTHMTNANEDLDDSCTIDNLTKIDEDNTTFDEMILEEEVEHIKTYLSESEYNCIMARYFGASYKETATTFGYTVKQVDNKIQSVRKAKSRYVEKASLVSI